MRAAVMTLGLLSMTSMVPLAHAEARRYALKQPAQIVAAPLHAGRYTLKGRFAPEENAGELREGGRYALIGRLGKGGQNCDASLIFGNGFEH
jgi:hypothetical protein